MALPKALQPALTPDELSFLAEQDHIEIVPNFSMSKIALVGVRYGVSRLAFRVVRNMAHCRVSMDRSDRHDALEYPCGLLFRSSVSGNAEYKRQTG